jgi:hypothetical protein
MLDLLELFCATAVSVECTFGGIFCKVRVAIGFTRQCGVMAVTAGIIGDNGIVLASDDAFSGYQLIGHTKNDDYNQLIGHHRHILWLQ